MSKEQRKKEKTKSPKRRSPKRRMQIIKKFLQQENTKQLITRTIIFSTIIMITYLFIFLYFRHTKFFIEHLKISTIFYADWLTGLKKIEVMNAILFSTIGFIIVTWKQLKKTPLFERNKKETIIMAIITTIILISHYAFKYYIRKNQLELISMAQTIAATKYIFNIAFIISLFITIYTIKFTKYFIKNYWKKIILFAIIGIIYFYLIQLFQLIWYQLSYFVSKTIQQMLSLTFNNVYFTPGTATQGPRLGLNSFIVGVSKECSGIDSLLLFISLYSLLLFLDWNRLNKKRMLILLLPGIIMTIAYNIIRIYLLILVGVYIDPQFAIDTFHTNIGWVLFLIVFMIFWNYGSKYAYEKQNKKSKTKKQIPRKNKKTK